MIQEVVSSLRAAYDSSLTRPLQWRLGQLEAMRQMLVEEADTFIEALRRDLGKHPTESRLTEIDFLVTELDHVMANLESWLAPRPVPTPLTLRPGRSEVRLEPLGVVLVIAPWNYPLQLVLSPAIGALAAGNAVLLKPSEIAPATSAALAELVPRYLDSRAVAVTEGGVEHTTTVLAQRFDHIFYTGNAQVGRIVMRAAAEHLTPVTLELGGKSPAWVDDSADLAVVARRLVWGKFVNAGQTCVAPDHVLATPEVNAKLAGHLQSALTDAFGADPRRSGSYGRIVSTRHTERLAGLLDGSTPLIGGQVDVTSKYVAPTVLTGVTPDHPTMAEEIFGPVLPLVDVAGVDEAIAQVNAGPKPLATYLFTERDDVVEDFLARTSSGSVGVNVPLAQLSVPGLPFGGVGESGMGSYHGRHSVDTFSHHRSVLVKPLHPDTLRAVYQPYTPLRRALVAVLAPKPGRRLLALARRGLRRWRRH